MGYICIYNRSVQVNGKRVQCVSKLGAENKIKLHVKIIIIRAVLLDIT